MYVDTSGNLLCLVMSILLAVYIFVMIIAVCYNDDGGKDNTSNNKNKKDQKDDLKDKETRSYKNDGSSVDYPGFIIYDVTPSGVTYYTSSLTSSFYGPEYISGNSSFYISPMGHISSGSGGNFSYDGKDLVDILLDMRIW